MEGRENVIDDTAGVRERENRQLDARFRLRNRAQRPEQMHSFARLNNRRQLRLYADPTGRRLIGSRSS